MNKNNIEDSTQEEHKFLTTINLFFTGLGAYFSLVLTSISILLIYVVLSNSDSIKNINLTFLSLLIAFYFISYSILTTKTNNNSLSYRIRQTIKRLFDVLITSAVIFSFWPIILLIGLAIRIDSPGPVIYRSKRVGQFGKLFDAYKFRTMKIDDADSPQTWIGRILRRFSLDELPMLYNVLEGKMSLVGPRARIQKYLEKTIDIERKILSVKPGITGLWLISIAARSSFVDEIGFDLEYVKKWSLSFDAKLILKTIDVVLLGRK